MRDINKFQKLIMSYNESDDSDCEGFIPNKMIIRRRETSDLKDQDHFKHFQPHYLIGETVIKKQPPQCNLPISTIQRQPFQIAVQTCSDSKGQLPTASSLYLSPSYQLVYSRFRKPFGQGDKSAFINEIIIKSIGRSEYFRSLKNWRCDNAPGHQTQRNLRFDSKLQGGNLLCAFHSIFQQDTYILFMQNDTNTYGYNQWFYFSIQQAKPGKKYTFRIVNFKKNYSFFKKGMQPYLFSLEKSRADGCGWYMGGTGFEYYKSNFAEKDSGNYYTLSFQLQFKYANDFVMISSSLPYSYSKLIQQIEAYQDIAIKRSVDLQVKSVSKTLGGNQVPYIKIAKRSIQKKKIILITARQHSGQTWSSYLMDELLMGIVKQQDSYYQWLLGSYDFHVFPMVNVDGVIYGNFRCDLAGYDLNRCWKDPSPVLQPHIYRIRQAVHQLTDCYSLHLYLDLHTHSKEHGVFAYSCVQSQQCRRLPYIISLITPLFRYPACTFGISSQKKTTARSQIFDISANINTITIELSAFGYRHPTFNGLVPFSIANIHAVAQAIVNSLYYYNNTEHTKIVPIDSHIADSKQLHNNTPIQDNTNGAISGSDSEPEIDAIQQSIKVKKILKDLKTIDLKIKKSKPRVKKLKTQMNLTSSPESLDIDSIQISPVNRYRAVTEFSKQKRVLQPANLSRKMLSSTCAPQRTAQSFKKIFKTTKLPAPGLIEANLDSPIQIQYVNPINPPKPLNLLQFSLKKLPIYNFEKKTHINPAFSEKVDKTHISNLSLSKHFSEQQERGAKNGMVTYYRTKRQGNVSLTSTGNKNVKDPFQFLCIMSQSKKLQQIQRIKQRKQLQQQSSNKIINRTKVGLIKHSTVLQRYTKNRKIQNSEVLSKIWVRNFHRYSKSLEDQIDE